MQFSSREQTHSAALLLLAVLGGLLLASEATTVFAEESPAKEPELFFGDLHVHSSWSFDAYAARVVAGPKQAYEYARGKPIQHISGETIQLTGPPLDFIALTDHAEYLGVVQASAIADHPLRKQPLIQTWYGANKEHRQLAWQKIIQSFDDRRGLPSLTADSVIQPAWRALIDAANRHNKPGQFTAFLGFEYTANPDGQNLHRNVIFRGETAPARPFSSMDSPNPEDLWQWLDDARSRGHDGLAIPHNANGSNGLMFSTTQFDGSPVDVAWAKQRHRNEPVAEIVQIKGQSETHPALSPDDPWANFEVIAQQTIKPELPSQPKGSYYRDALRRGLLFEKQIGIDPFAFGAVGSTDGHNAASPFEETNYSGKIGSTDPTREERLRRAPSRAGEAEPTASIITQWGAAGLAGIWAPSNTRDALFDALRRRETFATSGPRIRVRLRADWDSPETEPGSPPKGVPMGGSLTSRPNGKSIPHFFVESQRDPLSATLERVQVVKGWLRDGKTYERVFDIACAGGQTPNTQTHLCDLKAGPPDLETCEPKLIEGAAELRADWHDPTYQPSEPSFYYVRVLEIPTCRWSTLDAKRIGQAPPVGVPRAIQERAVTSPVWVR